MKREDKQLTLIDHLAEFRKRLLFVVVVNVAAAFLCYAYSERMMQLILQLNKGMNLVYLTPSELFLVYVKLSLLCGGIFVSPITVLQVWAFVSKGLYRREKKYIVCTFLFGVIFFVMGVVFCYQIVLPTTLNFFESLVIPGIESSVSIDAFTNFAVALLCSFGLVFELPVLVFLLTLLGIVQPETLLKKQPIIILCIFVVSAFITPPDVVSQLLIAGPMIVLFEFSLGLSVLVSRFKGRKQKKKEGMERV